MTLFDKQIDPITLPEDMWNPPVKSCSVVDAYKLRKFSCLDWMRLFEVSKRFPRSRPILPLAADLPASGGTLEIGLTVPSNDALVAKEHSCIVMSVVSDVIQQDILVTIGVTLSVHGLRD